MYLCACMQQHESDGFQPRTMMDLLYSRLWSTCSYQRVKILLEYWLLHYCPNGLVSMWIFPVVVFLHAKLLNHNKYKPTYVFSRYGFNVKPLVL